ncbi:LOW QUALITY PROTEIN: hypothetical protein HID58_017181 [Brassica napus]|uniref:Uncharacterized protein n=1 Tax=Brassica napus TaxID=3708 RepID=A0ABQ8D8W3_BRANA|nr:LOW QUALITY PROTEIN: hypothetical protein HID58_017181 [Brassica napus]
MESFVSVQSGDTDKAKKIREAAIFTISFVACDSPSGNQLLWSIFKALCTFCAYQTLSFSSNAFRALIYIESLEWALGLLIFCLLGFVSVQSGDTDKAKKIREAAIFTISFVACDSPSGNQLLWSIFKALCTFCAYQTLSFSSNAFRALIYIESLELLQPLQPPLPPFPTPPSTLSALEGPLSPLLVGSSDSRIPNGEFMDITILLLDELGADLLRRGATRHDTSSFTILETLMNHKANIRALFQSNGWILSQPTAKPEEGREVECCVLEDGFVSVQSGDTDKAKKIREAAIFTISFVACDSPSGNQLLWSIFKALCTFCAYQTLSFSSNAFRALIYIESLELHLVSNFSFSVFQSLYFLTSVAKMTYPAAPAASAAIAAVPYSTFNSLRLGSNINKNGEFMDITILLLDELGANLLRRGATRHDASSFTILETLMNHKANIRALFQSNGWILSQTTAKPEEGREVECCVSEDGCGQCVILAMKISVALIYATTVLELPNKY